MFGCKQCGWITVNTLWKKSCLPNYNNTKLIFSFIFNIISIRRINYTDGQYHIDLQLPAEHFETHSFWRYCTFIFLRIRLWIQKIQYSLSLPTLIQLLYRFFSGICGKVMSYNTAVYYVIWLLLYYLYCLLFDISGKKSAIKN